ncbi:MAG: nuclear transport factor 2 family protein [Planctomycetota bacterium]
MNNKAICKQAMNALFKDFDAEALSKSLTKDYIQHNPHVPSGLDAIINLLPVLKEAGLTYETHRMLEDDDLVLTHTTYANADVFGAKTVIAFDVWRIENGRVAEHWDAIIAEHETTASGRSQTDGATDIGESNKTEENKALVESFVTEVLINEQTDKMEDYLRDGVYDQHNPLVEDGPDALKQALTQIHNHRIHRVIGEGNFVLTQSEGSWNEKPVAIYDLFRVDAGKIAEHWDVIQEIPAEMAHANGMF